MKLQPLYDHVLLRRKDPETKTPGGIVIPDNAKETPVEGEVLAVGTGKMVDNGGIKKLIVEVGDRVLIGRYAGTETTIAGEKYVLLRESEILGVFKE